jgi:DNA-binding transcriptional ArsR family regulator
MRSLRQRVEILRVIAHPVRIHILEELSKGVKCVSDFGTFLNINQPNVSQHLSLLRRHGVIDCHRDGRLRCYFLKDPVVTDLLHILKKEYAGELPAPPSCPITGQGKYPGKRRR